MNVWIIDHNSGTTLLYNPHIDLLIDEDLVSGLLTALNKFTIVEFKQGIESVDMGGLRWVYSLDEEFNILFVAASGKDVNARILKAQLDIVRDNFIQEHVKDRENWRKGGNVEQFQGFTHVIDHLISQWNAAEEIIPIANFMNLVAVFQQILSICWNLIETQLPLSKRRRIRARIERMFENYHNNDYVKKHSELKKVTLSTVSGINIADVDPMKCNPHVIGKQFANLVKRVIGIIKLEMGEELSTIFFLKGGLYDYVVKNYQLLKELNLDGFLVRLLLQSKG